MIKLGDYRLGAARLTLKEFKPMPGIVELSGLHTDEWHRRKGIATRLLKLICNDADRTNTVIVLRPDEPWHEDWYKKHGFDTIQVNPVILMVRQHRKDETCLPQS